MPTGDTPAASGYLKRAKSTSSVPRRNPANTNAVTAASLAFERAKAAQMDTVKGNDPPRISRRQSTTTNRLSGEGSHFSRQRSRLRSSMDESRTTTLPGSDVMRGRRRLIPSNVSPKPGSEASNLSVTSPDMRFAKRYDGYGVPANARLCKTKSCATQSSVTPTQEGHHPGLIRRLTVAAPATRENQTDEAILALARDRYLHEHQMTPLRKRSSFFAPFLLRSRKSKRDSMNTDETVSQGQNSSEFIRTQTSVLEHMPVPHFTERPSDMRTRASAPPSRRISSSFSSIKSSWKRTFGQGSRSSSGHSEMPPQHIVARTKHYGRPEHDQYVDGHVPKAYSATAALPPASPSPPTPPPHLVDVHRSWTHVRESPSLATPSGELSGDKSRITSWTGSTRQSTLVGVNTDQLPSIQESSDSRNASVLPGQSRDEIQYQGPSEPLRKSSSRFSLRGTVDGKRLFSALMRHKSNSAEESESRASATLDVVREYADDTTVEDGVDTDTPLPHIGSSGIRKVSLELPRRNSSSRIRAHEHSVQRHEIPSRSLVISPSVYSERNDPVMQLQPEPSYARIPTEPGMATVLTSEAVSKWPLGMPTRGHKQSTSNEWRTWVAGEAAGLEGRASFSLPAFSAPAPSTNRECSEDPNQSESDTAEYKDSPNSSRRMPSMEEIPDTPDWIEEPSTAPYPARGPPATGSSTTRFPPNATSIISRASQRSSSGIRRVLGITKVKDDANQDHRYISVEPSNTDLLSKSLDSPIQQRALQGSRQSRSRLPRYPRKPIHVPVGNNNGSPSKGHELDDNFLLRIRKGPYNASTNSFARMPTSSRDSLSVSKRSPAASRNENTPPSRGQRMAHDFLSKRKDKGKKGDGSPAFV